MFIIIQMVRSDIKRDRLTRRQFLGQIASAGFCVPFASLAALSSVPPFQKKPTASAQPPANATFSDSDEAFLEELERTNFQFFWGQAHPETGLVQDRCHAKKPVTSE